MPDAAPIHTEKLLKRYGSLKVLRGLSLHVPRGTLFGFLGPNGAGKSTTIRILLGLLRPSGGKAQLFGDDCWRGGAKIRADVGYLPGDVRFYGGWTARATLHFLARARKRDCHDEMMRLATEFALELDKPTRAFSRGMKQKLGLIQAMMHRPKLLILDEPTTGLDPVMQEVLYTELRRIRDDGRTVLFSSHGLAEVETLCDRVAILRGGELVEDEKLEVLRRRARQRVEIYFADEAAAGAVRGTQPPEGLEIKQQRGGQVRAMWSGDTPRLLDWLTERKVRNVTIAPPDLEHLFLSYYADEIREAISRPPNGANGQGGAGDKTMKKTEALT